MSPKYIRCYLFIAASLNETKYLLKYSNTPVYDAHGSYDLSLCTVNVFCILFLKTPLLWDFVLRITSIYVFQVYMHVCFLKCYCWYVLWRNLHKISIVARFLSWSTNAFSMREIFRSVTPNIQHNAVKIEVMPYSMCYYFSIWRFIQLHFNVFD